MFKTVAEWLKQEGKATPETNKTDELAALVTALMVEAAQADGHLSDDEEGLILGAIIRQFELTEANASKLWLTLWIKAKRVLNCIACCAVCAKTQIMKSVWA